MGQPTVCAVLKVTIEIPVRASGSEEKLCDLYAAAQREAEGILRTRLPAEHFRVIGPIEFSYAVVRAQ